MEILRRYGIALWRRCGFVGFAVDGAAADSAAGGDCGEALRPMHAAGRAFGLDQRRATEFADGDTSVSSSMPRIFQIFEERGERCPVAVGRSSCRRNRRRRRCPCPCGHRACPNWNCGGPPAFSSGAGPTHPLTVTKLAPGFYHPPGEEQVLAERMHAVALADGGQLRGSIQRPAGLAGGSWRRRPSLAIRPNLWREDSPPGGRTPRR